MTDTPNDTNQLRIIIADDHALVRGGLALMVKMVEANIDVLEANSFEQVEKYLSGEPEIDLVLLDLMMPGIEGMNGIEKIRASWPEVPIVVVSAKEDIHTIRNSLAAGAMGYIPKTSMPNVTASAIKLVLSGGVYIPPHVLQSENNSISSMQEDSLLPTSRSRKDAQFGLTTRQIEVISLIGMGKSNKAIAETLGLTAGTVKMHTSRIFKALDVENRTEAAAKFAELQKNSPIE